MSTSFKWDTLGLTLRVRIDTDNIDQIYASATLASEIHWSHFSWLGRGTWKKLQAGVLVGLCPVPLLLAPMLREVLLVKGSTFRGTTFTGRENTG